MVQELALQVFTEIGVELAKDAFARSRDAGRSGRPVLAVLGYGMLGALIGALTLLAFPHTFIRQPGWRVVNLVVTPIVAGYVMWSIGRYRERHGGARTRLSTFTGGMGFALGMSAVRYAWAR